MIADSFTPRRVLVLLGITTLLLSGLAVSMDLGLIPDSRNIGDAVSLTFGALPRIIACILFLVIADEHRDVRLVRLAWQALAAHSALRYLRGVFSSSIMDFVIRDLYASPWHFLLKEGLGVAASLLLLLGLLGVLYSYRRAGLERKPGSRYWVAIVISLALFGWMVLSHQSLEAGQSEWIAVRLLQPLDLMLNAAAAITCIMMYRYAVSLEGGTLARVVRWLVVYVLLSGVLVLLLQVVVPDLQRSWGLSLPLHSLWTLAPWFLTLAASVRAQMSCGARERLAMSQQSDRPQMAIQSAR